MKYTNTHAHLYRNKSASNFGELLAGDSFTLSTDTKFYTKIQRVFVKETYEGWDRTTYYNAVRLETGELALFNPHDKCVVAKDVRIDAKF